MHLGKWELVDGADAADLRHRGEPEACEEAHSSGAVTPDDAQRVAIIAGLAHLSHLHPAWPSAFAHARAEQFASRMGRCMGTGGRGSRWGGALGFADCVVDGGIGALLKASAHALDRAQTGGGAYLVWLGIQLWRSPPVMVASDAPGGADERRQRCFARGC